MVLLGCSPSKTRPKLQSKQGASKGSRYTWNPTDPCFDWKRPCFGGLTFKNRGHLGSIYIYIYIRLQAEILLEGQPPQKPVEGPFSAVLGVPKTPGENGGKGPEHSTLTLTILE